MRRYSAGRGLSLVEVVSSLMDSEWDVADSHPRDPWLALAVAIISILVLAYLGLENTHSPCMTDMVYRVTIEGCRQGP